MAHRSRRVAAVVAVVAVGIVVAVAVALLTRGGGGANQADRSADTVAATLGQALVLGADPLVTTELRVVEAATDDGARDVCSAFAAAGLAVGEWIIAGKNLNATTTATPAEASGNTSFAYLCMHQARVRDVAATNTSTVLQSIRVLQAARCPNALTTVYQPRPGTVICSQTINASIAIATGMYVSDVAATSVSGYDNTVPGWTTEDATVATSFSRFDNTTTSPIYVSYKRPLRPIASTKVLQNVSASDMLSVCNTLLGVAWEYAGDDAINASSSSNRDVVCIERATLNASQVESPVYELPTMLVDVALVSASSNCSGSTTDRQQLTSNWTLCLTYTSSATDVRFISDLRVLRPGANATLPATYRDDDRLWETRLQSVTTDDPNDLLAILYRQYTGIVVDAALGSAPSLSSSVSQEETEVEPSEPLLARSVSSSDSNDTQLRGSKDVTTDNGLVFKIVQLADLHMTGDATHECRNPPKEMLDAGRICSEADTTAFVERVLDAERPDLVVFSGDNVEVPKGNSIEAALSAALGPVEKRQIPYALVFGNHDDENGQSRADMAERVVGRNAFSRMQWGPRAVSGVGNYELSVRAPRAGAWGAAGSAVFRLYFLDSHGYPDASRYPGVKSTYDWIKPDQVAYYKELARAARDNLVGNATSMADNATSTASNDTSDDDSDRNATAAVPAVMFFHIPIPEYASAGTAPRYRSGDKNENVASAEVHSNLFSALVEMGDVKATFVGHDHVNEYCYLRQGVQLCYGGGAGFAQAYGSAQFARRTRVVEWRVDERNRRRIVSWKRHYGAAFETRQHEEVLYDEQDATADKGR